MRIGSVRRRYPLLYPRSVRPWSSPSGQTYHSAAEEARAIHDHLIKMGCTNLQLGFGASLGGVVLFELLKYEDLTFDHIFLKASAFMSMPRCSALR